MNFRLANIAAAAGGLVLTLGFLSTGGAPTEDETLAIVMASFLTGGIVLGLLAEKRDRAERDRQDERRPHRI